MPRKKTARRLREARQKARQNVSELRKSIDKRLSPFGFELDDVEKIVAKSMSEKPLLTLGIAFVLGMAVGVAISKSGD